MPPTAGDPPQLGAADTEPPPTLPTGELPLVRGGEIGRYLVLQVIGQGGVGRVVEAYDPQLERRVAIKVLRRDPEADIASSGLRERVLREARALARVVHPNIVAVYDAGFHHDELYVVMELIDGVNLRRWLGERPRGPDEVREVFLQAGRGLAAAHAAGVVHRDFKPDNVLVGDDRRVRVADFGLARVLDAATAADAPLHPATRAEGFDTIGGAIVGTPAYMAPEQFARGKVDARADQFGFCVALHEALHGERPFPGGTVGEIERAIRGGRIRGGERRDVPAWLRAIIARGLAVDPAARFPSMNALLDALEADPEGRRRRRLRAVLLGLAVAGLAALAVVGLRRGETPSPCREAAAAMASVFGPDAHGPMARAFLATGRPYAVDTFQRVAARLDGYGEAWRAMRVEACEATRVRGTQSDAALDLRMRCLDRRLEDLRALVTVFSRDVDGQMLARAAELAGGLPPLAGCADLDQLSAVVPAPADPALRARADGVHATIVTALAKASTRGSRDGLGLADRAVAEARAIGWKPLLAEALQAQSRMASENGDLAAAETSIREALQVAAEAHDDQAVAAAALELVNVVGHLRARYEEAAHLHPMVEAALARAGAGDELRGRWQELVGKIAILEDQPAEARLAHERAIELYQHALGPDHLSLAEPYSDLCYALRQQGAYAEAEETCRRAVALLERHVGPAHPLVAGGLSYLAIILTDRGNYDEAEAVYKRALGIYGGAIDPDDDDILQATASFGALLLRRGRLAEAHVLLERALAGRERTRGPRHTSSAVVIGHLGRLALAEGRLDQADAFYARAEDIDREALGKDNVRTMLMTGGRAAVLMARGRPAQALALQEQVLAVLEKRLGPSHRDTALALAASADALLALGRIPEAQGRIGRAIEALERTFGADHPDLAGPRFTQARLLWVDPRQRERARALAERARAAAAPGGPLRPAIEAWLARPGATY